MKKTTQIAIDGPAGAGKSTVARILAEKLGFIYIDTGAMYRALTYKALENKIDFSDKNSLIKLAQNTKIIFKNDDQNGNQKIFCDNKDVTEYIRTPEVSEKVSLVAAIPQIREQMVKLQQNLGEVNNVIMDGRDIGTVVLPQAKYKFFLTASLQERAKRRMKELQKKGYQVKFEEIFHEIKNRDRLDSERKTSPLKPANDALIIDTTDLSLDEVVNKLLEIILRGGK